ncbi:MAG: DEAD/DEAH box helicase, partial [Bacteroides sp.]|nr:DEAD/DEAH box helicase [Bacteroides sp.]
QIRMLKTGVHIIVATPGRLIDLMERGVAKLDGIINVVMDEADEMLNMGFTDSINAILEQVPSDRNTLMFSATMSAEISRIAKQYLKDAKEITIGTKNEGTKNVNHVAYMVHAKDKYNALKRIADYYPQIYGIIFCRTRKETQEIADKLIQDGYNADSLHGELSQAQRDLVMQKFRQGHLQLLVATDVAARGLDVNDLTHVINYGLPDDVEVYTHRSGRTGRAGKTGISIAIMNLREKSRMKEIERIINKKFTIGEMPTGKEICEQQLIKVIDDIEKVKVNEEEIEAFLPGIYRKLEWLSKEDLLKRVVSMEFNRFLEYYSNAPEIETPSKKDHQDADKENKRKNHGTDKEKTSRKAEEGYARLFLNMGKSDGFFATQIIEMINRHVKKQRVDLGRIDLMQNFSFFEVLEDQAAGVIKALNKVNINGRRVIVELAGENNGKSDKGGKKRDSRKEGSAKKESRKAEKPAKAEKEPKKEKKNKPSREERGYTAARGPKKKDDWMKFFAPENSKWLKGDEPNFEEEGWARRKPKKK